MINFSFLIGKTITKASVKKLQKYDDEGFLQIAFSDGTEATIVASYGEYTGRSDGEYPTYVGITTAYSGELVDCAE